MTPFYLDYNASAPVLPLVQAQAMALLKHMGNGSSVHTHGRVWRKHIEDARHGILERLKAPNHGLYFTSGATEANAMVMHTLKEASMTVALSAIEHESVRDNAQQASFIHVTQDGVIDLGALEDFLKKAHQPTCVSVMAANNETGVIQPLEKISSLCLKYGALLHVDATQGMGRMPLSFMDMTIDYMTFSSHKIGGFTGVGALIAKKGVPLSPLFRGGGQEEGYRSGTLNGMGIMAFAKAHEQALAFDWTSQAILRDDMEKNLKAYVPDSIIAGEKVTRLPNTSCLSMPGVAADTQVIAMDLEGLSISAGAACSSGKVKTSHVLKAMGFDNEADSFIRISLCPDTPRIAIDTFIDCWKKIYNRCKGNT